MKRKLFIGFVVVLISISPLSADAARLWTTGWELNSSSDGVEITNIASANVNVSSVRARTGTYSVRVNPTAGVGFTFQDFSTPGLGSTDVFTRFYLYVNTLPSASTSIFEYDEYGTNSTVCGLLFKTDGTLQLYGYTGSGDPTTVGNHIGSPSSALSTGTWYRVEILCNRDSSGSQVLTASARLDGTQFASGTKGSNPASAGVGRASFGVDAGNWGLTSTTDFYIDDIAVNDTSGAGQTTWPGAGSVVLAVPNAAGDNNCNIGDYSMINEIPPSDTATTGSTMCELNTTTSIGDFNATDTTTLAIDSFDTISLVDLIIRVREASAGTSNYLMRVKSATGGTVTASAAVDAGNATARTNPSSTTSFINRLVSYTDPTTGIAWTPTGTNSIDNMQIGAATTDGSPATWVLGLYGMVEYVDGIAPAVGAKMRARLQNARFKLSGGRFILRSN